MEKKRKENKSKIAKAEVKLNLAATEGEYGNKVVAAECINHNLPRLSWENKTTVVWFLLLIEMKKQEVENNLLES